MKTNTIILLLIASVALVGLIPFISPQETGLQFYDYTLAGYPYYFFTGKTFNANIIKSINPSAGERTATNLIINNIPNQFKYLSMTKYGSGYYQTRIFPEELQGKVFAIGDPRMGDYKIQNGIVIGTPCHNPVVAELLGIRSNCNTYFSKTQGLVKIVESNGRIYLVITGYSGEEVQATAQLFNQRVYDGKNRGKEMKTVLKKRYQGVMVPNLQLGETIGKEMKGMGGY
ncbi:hypothetical protein KY315_03525 [Candidatus Woesearchaeota archaeon]|nr:hypothetical protein [Candidatus Woesearchaeota archaeon]